MVGDCFLFALKNNANVLETSLDQKLWQLTQRIEVYLPRGENNDAVWYYQSNGRMVKNPDGQVSTFLVAN